MSSSPLHLPPTGVYKGKEKSNLQQRDDQNNNIPKTPDAKDIIRGFVKTNDNEPPRVEQKGTPQFFQMKNNVPVAASPVKKTLTIASEPLKEQATQSPRIDKSQSQSQDKEKEKEKTPRKLKGGENSPAPVVQRIDSVPTSVQRVPMKKAKYTASLTWFEWMLIMLNIVIFLGILFTLIILVRIFAVVHQKDINDFFAYLVSLN
jgi:hypothetical protein